MVKMMTVEKELLVELSELMHELYYRLELDFGGDANPGGLSGEVLGRAAAAKSRLDEIIGEKE